MIERRQHFKMYKAGKFWCLAAAMILTMLGAYIESISADSTETKNNSDAVKATLPNGIVDTTNNTTSSSLTNVQKETNGSGISSNNSNASEKVSASTTLAFNETDTTIAYLSKGASLYKSSTGSDFESTISDNNVEVLREKDPENGRVLVEIKESKIIAYDLYPESCINFQGFSYD